MLFISNKNSNTNLKIKIMKTFKDLKFEKHYYSPFCKEAKQAKMNFENGFGVSVLFGNCFYSNGRNTYEVAVLKNGVYVMTPK